VKSFVSILVLAALFPIATFIASAHPGSGIVVDEEGNLYFTHTGRGCGKIDPQGKLTYVHDSGGGHWLCLDPEGIFSRTQPKHFERVTLPGTKATLIWADGGSPIAVLRDGYLYYVSNDDAMTPGGLQVTRQSPDGAMSIFPPDGERTTGKLGITGLAAGPDGTLYVASPSGVVKLKKDGTFASVADSIELKDCDVDYPDHNSRMPLPSLRCSSARANASKKKCLGSALVRVSSCYFDPWTISISTSSLAATNSKPNSSASACLRASGFGVWKSG